jgi:hypothetical protein
MVYQGAPHCSKTPHASVGSCCTAQLSPELQARPWQVALAIVRVIPSSTTAPSIDDPYPAVTLSYLTCHGQTPRTQQIQSFHHSPRAYAVHGQSQMPAGQFAVMSRGPHLARIQGHVNAHQDYTNLCKTNVALCLHTLPDPGIRMKPR